MADEVTETTTEVVETEAPTNESTESETEVTQHEEDTTDWKAESRKHEKQARANAKELTALKALAEKAGLPLDEEGINTFLEKQTSTQRAVREKTLELAVFRNAAANEADANALLDSRTFMKAVEALDPEADDFNESVAQAITKATDSNPRLKVNTRPVVNKTGTDMNGGNGKKKFSEEEVAKMTFEEYAANRGDILSNNLR